MKIAYLGPEASYTQVASLHAFDHTDLIPQPTIRDCFKAVKNGEVEKAVVPLENSIEGTVTPTLDYLFDFEGITIEAELILPISHHFMVHPNFEGEVEKIYSHQQALAQCSTFLYEKYKDVPKQEFSSTSASAKRVADNPDRKIAAIANQHAAEMYGLKILHSGIQDVENNHTRFIVISKKGEALQLSQSENGCKTALLIILPQDNPGGLHQVLSVFAWRKMNLSKIESRTLKTGLGNYFFFITVASAWDPVLSTGALEELKALGCQVKTLGHYNEYILKS